MHGITTKRSVVVTTRICPKVFFQQISLVLKHGLGEFVLFQSTVRDIEIQKSGPAWNSKSENNNWPCPSAWFQNPMNIDWLETALFLIYKNSQPWSSSNVFMRKLIITWAFLIFFLLTEWSLFYKTCYPLNWAYL